MERRKYKELTEFLDGNILEQWDKQKIKQLEKESKKINKKINRVIQLNILYKIFI